MSEPLTVENIDVSYHSVNALHGISLEVKPGSVVTVLGANGAGKSTLARALSGLVPVRGGRVQLGDRDLTRAPAHEWRRAGIVHLPEGRGVFPGLTVRDNLLLAARQVASAADRATALEQIFEIFPVLKQRQSQLAGKLSGGEQQMLSLSRAFSDRPKLLIADELSLGLAPKLVDTVFASLARAKAAGLSILLMEQFVHRALELADSCVILTRGECSWSGPASEAKGEILQRYLGLHEGTGPAPSA